MRYALLALSLVFSLMVFPSLAEAKVLPQAGKSASVKTLKGVKVAGATIGVFPKLRSDKKALTVNFSNLHNAKSVSYSLVYSTATQSEGAGGALNLAGQVSDKAELLFGTCSASVCRYHAGVKDAKLEVSYISTNGKKYLKKFKIKI